MKNLLTESNNDMQENLKEIQTLHADVTAKEIILQENTEKYFSQKKIIEDLNDSYTKSNIKLKKFDEVAKLEMDIKVANNQLRNLWILPSSYFYIF